uniref:uncharacterized protein LOC114592728 isoform X1 n=1 Tax=Podarcis muralis TaxID=64176 RepID=UPI0010A00CFC|nr:uncharacterized protein LOC114592728 isoform X1 [Podarcis muralis]
MQLLKRNLSSSRKFCTIMMKLIVFVLLAVLIPAKYASDQQSCGYPCIPESQINQKIQEAVDSKVSSVLLKSQLVCTDAFARAADAHCPSGETLCWERRTDWEEIRSGLMVARRARTELPLWVDAKHISTNLCFLCVVSIKYKLRAGGSWLGCLAGSLAQHALASLLAGGRTTRRDPV